MGGEVAGMANDEAEKAVHFAHVVVMMLDVSTALGRDVVHNSLTHFERTMADKALQHGRPLIILANKMDLVGDDPEERDKVNRFLTHAVPQYDGVSCVPVSAKTGLGMPFVLPAIAEAYDKWCKRIQTSHLNEWLHDLKYFQGGGGPTSVMNKLRYATQVKARPPTFAFFLSGGKSSRRRRNKKAGNRKSPKDMVPNSVEKYLRNEIRSAFGLQGIPVRVMFK